MTATYDTTTAVRRPGGDGPSQRIAVSIGDLQGVAAAQGRGLLQIASTGVPVRWSGSSASGIVDLTCRGMQELLNLSDDLLLVRSDFRGEASPGTSWDIDTRGWLYMHFRLDGLTEDATPDGTCRTIGGGSFFVSASSRQRSFVREVLADVWRVVTVAFRPSFAMRDLQIPGGDLPAELRRFQAGDADVDFWYAGQLTSEMKSAAGALLQPSIQSPMRPIYLRAKVVELVCLAVENLQQPESAVDSPLKLTQRDMRALEEARRILDQCVEVLSLEQLARHVGLNRRKLALGFKHLFGITAGDYQREVRLELARRALEGPVSSVGYAAAVAGYSDVGSFGKAFRARYGVLPSELRSARAAVASRK